MEYTQLTHIFEPVFDEHSEILILGTFPSVKSRENHFYYGHPQNRFWKVLAELTGCSAVPQTVAQKKQFLLERHIAVWDVIASCEIAGSSDSSIRNVTPNDIGGLLDKTQIQRLYANGGKAYELYMRYCYADCGRSITKLPSTSPANASFTLERLCKTWREEILLPEK